MSTIDGFDFETSVITHPFIEEGTTTTFPSMELWSDEWMWRHLQDMDAKNSAGNAQDDRASEEIASLAAMFRHRPAEFREVRQSPARRWSEFMTKFGTRLLLVCFLVIEVLLGVLVVYLANH